MTRSPRTVSIRHLQAAVKTALEATKKKHHDLKVDAVSTLSSSDNLPILYRFPWICGIPVPWPEYDLKNLATFNDTFVANLASDPQISPLGVEGKFDPALYISGGTATIGFVPSNVSLTE
jgi:hypothetical protein